MLGLSVVKRQENDVVTIRAICFSAALVLSTLAQAEVDWSQCKKQLSDFREPGLGCAVLYKLNDKERAELAHLSGDAVRNLSCTAAIKFNKAEFVRALSEPTVNLPRITIQCSILANDGRNYPVSIDIAPEFTFVGKKVEKASLGVGNASGAGFLGAYAKNQLSSDATNQQLKELANQAIDAIGK